MGLDLTPGGQQGNSNSGPFGSHGASTREPLPREESPFVPLRAVREPLGEQHSSIATTRGLWGTPQELLLEENLQ